MQLSAYFKKAFSALEVAGALTIIAVIGVLAVNGLSILQKSEWTKVVQDVKQIKIMLIKIDEANKILPENLAALKTIIKNSDSKNLLLTLPEKTNLSLFKDPQNNNLYLNFKTNLAKNKALSLDNEFDNENANSGNIIFKCDGENNNCELKFLIFKAPTLIIDKQQFNIKKYIGNCNKYGLVRKALNKNCPDNQQGQIIEACLPNKDGLLYWQVSMGGCG